MSEDTFRTYSSLLLKGTDVRQHMSNEHKGAIGGVISTSATDFQGDELVQEGVDWSYFADKGHFNYNHQPGTIVGEPTRVIRKGHKTLVEGHLYLTTPLGKKIYDQARAIQKAGGRWTYGFSVEGTVLERDPENPSRITKARVMNVSVCEHPVNGEAHMLLKSMSAVGYQEASEMGGGNYAPLVTQSIDRSESYATFKTFIKNQFPSLTDEQCDRIARGYFDRAYHDNGSPLPGV